MPYMVISPRPQGPELERNGTHGLGVQGFRRSRKLAGYKFVQKAEGQWRVSKPCSASRV
jgi:hypothetical protein